MQSVYREGGELNEKSLDRFQYIMPFESDARMNRIAATIIVAVSCAWSFAIAITCWYAGDYMIGFSPFILFGFPFAAAILSIGLLVASSRKSKVIAGCSVLCCVLIAATLFNIHRITWVAWRNSLSVYSETNQAALRLADFSSAEFTVSDFPDEQKMAPIDGFEWYCHQHHAAPNGEFRGFMINSIKHIYVNKIRHGVRGVAWIPEPDFVAAQSDYEYQYSGVDNWYVWTYGG